MPAADPFGWISRSSCGRCLRYTSKSQNRCRAEENTTHNKLLHRCRSLLCVVFSSARQRFCDFDVYRRHRPQEDLDIQPKGSAAGISNIETNHFVECRLVLSTDLPQPGHARNRIKPTSLPRPILFRLIGNTWPRSDQAHFAAKYVNELRQFIETAAPNKIAERNDSGITGHIQLGHRFVGCHQASHVVLMET